jgi:hypothetical protein
LPTPPTAAVTPNACHLSPPSPRRAQKSMMTVRAGRSTRRVSNSRDHDEKTWCAQVDEAPWARNPHDHHAGRRRRRWCPAANLPTHEALPQLARRRDGPGTRAWHSARECTPSPSVSSRFPADNTGGAAARRARMHTPPQPCSSRKDHQSGADGTRRLRSSPRRPREAPCPPALPAEHDAFVAWFVDYWRQRRPGHPAPQRDDPNS